MCKRFQLCRTPRSIYFFCPEWHWDRRQIQNFVVSYRCRFKQQQFVSLSLYNSFIVYSSCDAAVDIKYKMSAVVIVATSYYSFLLVLCTLKVGYNLALTFCQAPTVASTQGRFLLRSNIVPQRLLFVSGFYSLVASIQGKLLFKEIPYQFDIFVINLNW